MYHTNTNPGNSYMHPNVHCSTIYNSQDMEATLMSIDRGMNKDVVHIYNGILLSHKKEQNNAICSNMDEPRDCHNEWSKSDRERQIPYDITYMWNLKKWYKWTYLQNRNRVIDVENKLMVTRGEGERDKLGDWDWHIHATIYKIGN